MEQNQEKKIWDNFAVTERAEKLSNLMFPAGGTMANING